MEVNSIVATALLPAVVVAYSLLLLMFVVFCVKYSHQTINPNYDLESSNEFGNIMDWSENASKQIRKNKSSNKISCEDDIQYYNYCKIHNI